MITFFKGRWSKKAKLFGVAVFVFLLFFNVQILTSLNNKGDINLLGIKISLYSASATTGYKHLYAWWDTGS